MSNDPEILVECQCGRLFDESSDLGCDCRWESEDDWYCQDEIKESS